MLGHFPWRVPRDIHEAVVHERLVGIRGGVGWGKTRTLSEIVCHEMDCHEDTVLISTATTWTQVAAQLWREIHAAFHGARKKMPGRLLDTKWEIDDRWFALGISTKKPESLAGFHASVRIAKKYAGDPEAWARITDDEFFGAMLEELEELQDAPRVVVVVDEASGIDDRLWPALDGLLSNPGSKMILAGNPRRLQGRHFKVFHPDGNDPEDTPDRKRGVRLFTVDSRLAPRAIVSQAHIDSYVKRCGPNYENHPVFVTDVKGEHAASSEESVYPMALLEACALIQPAAGDLRMGVDLSSGEGRDSCFAVLRDKGRVVACKQWNTMHGPKADLVKSARIIVALAKGWGVPPERVNIDQSGLGIGVLHLLHSDLFNFGCCGVEFGGGIECDWRDILGPGPRLKNRRQELHWVLWRLLQENLFSIPHEERYAPIWADLVAIRKKEHLADGEDWAVEKKDDFVEREKRSSDASDALITSLSKTEALKVSIEVAGGSRR